MLEKLKNWAREWLGVKVDEAHSDPEDDFVRRYEDIRGENITATIANKLAMLTMAESGLNISERDGGTMGARVALIEKMLREIWDGGHWISAQTFGKGGKILVPSYSGGRIRTFVLDQNRMRIHHMDGGRIAWATLAVDARKLERGKVYLLADYQMEAGQGERAQRIRYRAVNDAGEPVDLRAVDEWAQISPEISIDGTDRLLLAHLKCPRDSRANRRDYGVPITFGAEKLVEELTEHANIYRREYRLTRPMLGLDASLWRDPGASLRDVRPLGIAEIKANVQDSDFPFIPPRPAHWTPRAHGPTLRPPFGTRPWRAGINPCAAGWRRPAACLRAY